MSEPGALGVPLLLLDAGDAADAFRVLCLVDGPGATWRISFERPLRAARRAGRVRLACAEERAFEGVSLEAASERFRGLLDGFAPHLVVLSRFAGRMVTPVLDAVRRADVPVVYHIDDDLFSVPAEIGAAKAAYYGSAARRGSLLAGCRGSDLVLCSTQALATRLGRFGFGAPIVWRPIYCALNEPVVPFRPAAVPTVGYMGSSGHRADLEIVVPALSFLMRTRRDLRFEVFGTVAMPDELQQGFPDRTASHPPADGYDAFLETMGGLGWSVGLAPLLDIPFNTVKANTKFVEYSGAGIPSVVSASPVYRSSVADGAGAVAATTGDWADAIGRLLDRPEAARLQVETAQQRLRGTSSLDQHGRQVLEVLSTLRRSQHATRDGTPA